MSDSNVVLSMRLEILKQTREAWTTPKRFHDLHLPAIWGALWGVALGFWLLAPHVLSSHHLFVTTLRQWVILGSALATAFAVVGAGCGLFAGFPLAVWQIVQGRSIVNFFPRTYGLVIGILLIPVYIAVGEGVIAAKLGGVVGIENYPTVFKAGVIPYLVVSSGLLFLHRFVRTVQSSYVIISLLARPRCESTKLRSNFPIGSQTLLPRPLGLHRCHCGRSSS